MILEKSEIENRINRFYELMNERCPDWDIVLVFDRVNQYYFTGTIQDSILIFTKSKGAHFFARKSYSRAKMESNFENIHKMNSFGDIVGVLGSSEYENGYAETSKVPIDLFNMANKHIKIKNLKSADAVLEYQRSIKSDAEIEIIKETGKRHIDFLINVIPNIIEENMTELDFAAKSNYELINHGHHGTIRFSMFQTNPTSGQIAFGENSTYPTSFDGPGGSKGLNPSQPHFGDRKRKLRKGDLIFADIPYSMYGYHTDVTRIYIFGDKPSEEIKKAHGECLRIEKLIASYMKPGAVPADIYNNVIEQVDKQYLDNFMGVKGENVKFLGHGAGLYINETPVLSPKFTEPLEKNMVIAIEPKISIEGVGMVGVENTYIITDDGCECITEGGEEIIEVYSK
ncbi:MAG: Xaa-Pro peptidase family protein [Eubacteriales bacterium]